MQSSNRSRRGQTLTEYGLLLALVAVGALAVVSILGGSLGSMFSATNEAFSGDGGAGGTPSVVVTLDYLDVQSGYADATLSVVVQDYDSPGGIWSAWTAETGGWDPATNADGTTWTVGLDCGFYPEGAWITYRANNADYSDSITSATVYVDNGC